MPQVQQTDLYNTSCICRNQPNIFGAIIRSLLLCRCFNYIHVIFIASGHVYLLRYILFSRNSKFSWCKTRNSAPKSPMVCLPRTERCLSSVLSNCVSVSLMPTLGSGARKTNKYRDFSVCQIWCLLCFYQYFRKLIAFLENFFFALIIVRTSVTRLLTENSSIAQLKFLSDEAHTAKCFGNHIHH